MSLHLTKIFRFEQFIQNFYTVFKDFLIPFFLYYLGYTRNKNVFEKMLKVSVESH